MLLLHSNRGEIRSRGSRKTLMLLIGMTVAGLLTLITLLALSSFPSHSFLIERNIGITGGLCD